MFVVGSKEGCVGEGRRGEFAKGKKLNGPVTEGGTKWH